jgi:cysteine desulfurase/selenocysteine lyase
MTTLMTTRSELEGLTNVPPLPDVEQLTRWANEFFSTLPSGGVDSVQPAVGQPVTETITDIPPSSGHAKVPSSFSVPHESGLHELATPSRAAEPAAADSPYYFLQHAQTERLDAVSTHDLTRLVGDASSFAVKPENFGLQGIDELKSLATPRIGAPGLPSGSAFYFLDQAAGFVRHAAAPSLGSAHPPFDVQAFRRDFPILNEKVNGRPLVWLDNAATTQKPQVVIDRLSHFYQHENSNIHRAAHELAARSTDAYENARETVARFIGASSPNDVVFVRGSTEAINLVAQSWGRANIGPGDEIIVSWLEHHANIVPWQQLCAEKGAVLRVIPVDDSGQILLSEYRKLLSHKTKLVAFTQVSNALGTITPAEEIIELARRAGAKVLLDGAQSISHIKVDVQKLDCDWLVFSGHKIYGPTGIGALYGKPEVLEAMSPWQGGGNMIEDVTFEKTVYQSAPARFEAGTGNIADAVGLGTALEYVQKVGIENIAQYEHELLCYATELLSRIPGLRLIGTARDKTSVLSFVLKGFNTVDIGAALNKEGIAVRSGHHCAQPILRRFGLESTVRPSLAFYNTYAEIDWLAAVVRKIQCGSIPLGR